MEKFLNTDFDTPSWKVGDWALSCLSIAVGLAMAAFWGLHFGAAAWIVGGIVGCWSAWWRPLTKLQNMLRGIIVRRATR
jgi:hypothetical protein